MTKQTLNAYDKSCAKTTQGVLWRASMLIFQFSARRAKRRSGKIGPGGVPESSNVNISLHVDQKEVLGRSNLGAPLDHCWVNLFICMAGRASTIKLHSLKLRTTAHCNSTFYNNATRSPNLILDAGALHWPCPLPCPLPSTS